jgi:hypothetical protein
MRLIITIAAFILFQNSLHSQNELSESERNFIKSQGIRVKEQWDYKYNGNILSVKGFIATRTTYDKDGRIVEIVNYRNDSIILDVSTYAYNTNGDRTEFIRYKGNKSNLVFKQNTQYKALRQKSVEIGFNGVDDFRNLYNYDPSGKLTEIRYFTGKKLDEVRTLTYNGNETAMQAKDASGDILSYVMTKFDDRSRIIQETRLDKNQKITDQTFYSYDSRGNILLEEKKSPSKKPIRTEYVYDKSGKVQNVYYNEGDIPRYLKQNNSFDSNGFLLGEFWKNSPTSEQSFRKYNYDANGRLLSTDCYFASYKYKVLNKFVYQSF